MILIVEDAIVDRLEEALGDEVRVLRAADLAEVKDRSQVAPAVHVIYGGYEPVSDVDGGSVQYLETRWIIVVVSKHARGSVEARSRIDGWIDKVFTSLAGWRPGAAQRRMRLRTAPSPVYQTGLAFFPLAFTTRTTLRGAN